MHCHEQDFYFDYKDIVCVEAARSQSTVHTRTGSIHPAKVVTCKSVAEMEELLSDKRFLRIHKSWLVNLQHVCGHKKGDTHSLILSNTVLADISDTKVKDVLAAVEQFRLPPLGDL